MKIALIGASGHIGTEIAKQLESRSHTVTALTRPGKSLPPSASARAIGVDLFDTDALAEAIQGHDILASAYAPPQDKLGQISELTNALIAAAAVAPEDVPPLETSRFALVSFISSIFICTIFA